MNGEVIKSFLVGLGFGVDATSLSKFNKAINSATLKVTALYASVKIAAAGVVYGLSEISEGFEQMGYEYRIIAPAINKALTLRRELLKAYAAAGINIRKVIQDSVRLNFSLAKTKFAFEAIYRSVASRFFGLLTRQSDLFRQKLYAALPQIQNALEKFIQLVFKAFEATTILGTRLWSILTRLYGFFVKLHDATNGWSTAILGVVAAWKVLNSGILATPWGRALAALAALLALYDDFETYKEGGQSLFNWEKAIPIIDGVTAALSALRDLWVSFGNVIGDVYQAFYALFHSNPDAFFNALTAAGQAVLGVFSHIWDVIKNIAEARGKLLGLIAGFITNGNVQSNVQNGSGGVPQAAPMSAGAANSQVNQHLQQQTNINVTGSADAFAVGKAVSGEQNKVNFDMSRNMKTAAQ